MNNLHSVKGKTPLDFTIQLETWNYQYSEATDRFFKYVGMGIFVLNANWELSFIIRNQKGRLLIHDSKVIADSIEYLPWAEAEIFKPYLQLDSPLMLSAPR